MSAYNLSDLLGSCKSELMAARALTHRVEDKDHSFIERSEEFATDIVVREFKKAAEEYGKNGRIKAVMGAGLVLAIGVADQFFPLSIALPLGIFISGTIVLMGMEQISIAKDIIKDCTCSGADASDRMGSEAVFGVAHKRLLEWCNSQRPSAVETLGYIEKLEQPPARIKGCLEEHCL